MRMTNVVLLLAPIRRGIGARDSRGSPLPARGRCAAPAGGATTSIVRGRRAAQVPSGALRATCQK